LHDEYGYKFVLTNRLNQDALVQEKKEVKLKKRKLEAFDKATSSWNEKKARKPKLHPE